MFQVSQHSQNKDSKPTGVFVFQNYIKDITIKLKKKEQKSRPYPFYYFSGGSPKHLFFCKALFLQTIYANLRVYKKTRSNIEEHEWCHHDHISEAREYKRDRIIEKSELGRRLEMAAYITSHLETHRDSWHAIRGQRLSGMLHYRKTSRVLAGNLTLPHFWLPLLFSFCVTSSEIFQIN